mgnify:CR=1 FL=1
MRVSEYLKFLPEIGFLFAFGAAIVFSVYTNWALGGSLFQCAMIQEKGNLIQNLFAKGSVPESEWWYGIGHTSYILIKIPFFSYVGIRAFFALRSKTNQDHRTSRIRATR